MIKVIKAVRCRNDKYQPYWTNVWQVRVFGLLVFEREDFGSMPQ